MDIATPMTMTALGKVDQVGAGASFAPTIPPIKTTRVAPVNPKAWLKLNRITLRLSIGLLSSLALLADRPSDGQDIIRVAAAAGAYNLGSKSDICKGLLSES